MKIRWGKTDRKDRLEDVSYLGGIMVMRTAGNPWSDNAWRAIVRAMRNPLYQRNSFHQFYLPREPLSTDSRLRTEDVPLRPEHIYAIVEEVPPTRLPYDRPS